MKVKNLYDFTGKNPIYIHFFFKKNSETGELDNKIRQTFLKEFRPEQGFRICKKSDKNGLFYEIYLSGHKFKAHIFYFNWEVYGDTMPIGLLVKSCYPMTQSDTIFAATKSIHVTGVDEGFWLSNGGKENIEQAKRQHEAAKDFFKEIDILQDVIDKNAATHRSKENDRDDSQLVFLQDQLDLVQEKQIYETNNLFSLAYKSFKETASSLMDGVVYQFDIGLLEEGSKDDEKILKKLKEGAVVKVTATDGQTVSGTIVDLEEQWLRIKFRGSSGDYLQLAESGMITEGENPEYNYKIEALRSIRNHSANNTNLLDIIADHKADPYEEKIIFDPGDALINPSQVDAIQKALNVNDFLLVQGPPGTGKTTIITEMIRHFVQDGNRVLITSKNNLAVDNVIEKCMGMKYKNGGTIQCLRLGSEEKIIPSVRPALPRPLAHSIGENIETLAESALESQKAYSKEVLSIFDEHRKQIFTKHSVRVKVNDLLETAVKAYRNARISFWRYFLSRNDREFLLEALLKLEECLGKWNDMLSKNGAFRMSSEEYKEIRDLYTKFLNLCSEKPYRTSKILGYGKNNLLEKWKDFCTQQTASDLEVVSKYIEANDQCIKLAYKMPGKTWDEKYQFYDRALRTERLIIEHILSDWTEDLKNDDRSLEAPILSAVKIIGATCIGTNTNRNFKDTEYDIAIVDEAGQITMQDLLVPLVKAKKIILIGDHLQLPPAGDDAFVEYLAEKKKLDFSTINTKKEAEEYKRELKDQFSVSLFEDLFHNMDADHKVMLDTQFRMHPDIAEFISDYFYDGKYISGEPCKKNKNLQIAGFEKPIYFLDTAKCSEKFEDINSDDSIHTNSFEAKVLAKRLAKVLIAVENENYYQSHNEKIKQFSATNGEWHYDIGVITAYKAQIEIIRQAVLEELLKVYDLQIASDMVKQEHLTINTLDSFQGRDNQIIFYSFVRSNPEHNIGFLYEVRRLNVMMTRAKSLLVMVGDSECFRKSNSRAVHDGKTMEHYYGGLVDYCKKKNGYVDLSEQN